MENIRKIVSQNYSSLRISKIQKLEGYETENYKLTNDQSQHFILKIQDNENRLRLLSEHHILNELSNNIKLFDIPHPIKGSSKETVIEIGEGVFIRLLSFVEGAFLYEVSHSEQLLSSLGHFLGKLDEQLLLLESYNIENQRIRWDNRYALDNEPYLEYINDLSKRKLVEYFFLQFKSFVSPKLAYLRKSIIHNDANDRNVLTQDGRVSGIIDFGDMCYTQLINELAVALPYVLFDKEDPVQAACLVVNGYNDVLPLEKKELELLYYLIAIRLCISVCNSAYHVQKNPDNKNYISISEELAWSLLKKWISINPIAAGNAFKEACGYDIETISLENSLKRRYQFISKSMSISYNRPIEMSGAAFQYMYSADGESILDAYNNIPIVGHCHPTVVRAGQEQMALLNTNTRYIYDILHQYSEKLIDTFPQELDKIFYVNSGSAASDLAIRLALTHAKGEAIVVLENSYHGNTQLGIDISSYKFDGQGGKGDKEFIIKLPMPDLYRKGGRNENGIQLAIEAINIIKASGKKVAAFIAEPIMGCGGQVPLPRGYLKTVFDYVRKQGGVCIVDEVQIGFGRVGTHFWGFEQHDVIPDIVILGKPMGNGHPMGGVVCTKEVVSSFENGMEFFSSFGGNSVSCAIGLSVLEVLEEEKLQENALKVGSYIMKELRGMQSIFPIIGDVRGSGLFWGMELVSDPESKNPGTILAKKLKNHLRAKSILVGTDGPFNNVIKSKPPLCFDMDNADELLEKIHLWLKKNG